ncbi:hypothetical protein LCGC14_1570130 [marine sediment metagenome]|uniref:Uncharacterized protein n=1 Tax=marine sediment metagenome TaxID=412755 RepID=A0A0F9LKD1_9ZZZZ
MRLKLGDDTKNPKNNKAQEPGIGNDPAGTQLPDSVPGLFYSSDENMHRGYIKLWRKLQNSSLWLDEKFTRGQAWVDLICLANHKNGYIRKRGVRSIRVPIPQNLPQTNRKPTANKTRTRRIRM